MKAYRIELEPMDGLTMARAVIHDGDKMITSYRAMDGEYGSRQAGYMFLESDGWTPDLIRAYLSRLGLASYKISVLMGANK